MKRQNKYHAQRVQLDGHWFASKREAKRYAELRLLEKLGDLTNLRLQVHFPVLINGIKVFTYIADFTYSDRDEIDCVEDAKGMRTEIYRLKKKCVEAMYGIKIMEV